MTGARTALVDTGPRLGKNPLLSQPRLYAIPLVRRDSDILQVVVQSLHNACLIENEHIIDPQVQESRPLTVRGYRHVRHQACL